MRTHNEGEGKLSQTGKGQRRFKILLCYVLVLSPWIVFGAAESLKTGANSPLDWVDSDFAPRADYDHFSQLFGPSDVVVISWPGCTLDNPHVDAFVGCLRASPVFFNNGEWLFHRVVSGRETYSAFCRPPVALTSTVASDRLSGSLLGPDGKTTGVVIAFNAEGLKQRKRLVPLIRAAAMSHAHIAGDSLHLAGPVMDGYAVDLASQTTMNRFAPLSSIIVFCVCVLCLDSLYAATLVFGVSCVSQAVALSILHYCGGQMTALLIVLPALVQVLAIAGGMHLVNYYIDATKVTGSATAVSSMLRIGWLPCVLSSATTAIGLGSLAVSGLEAVREFGIYAAVGVIATTAVMFALLPGLLSWQPLRVESRGRAQRRPTLWFTWTDWLAKYGAWVCVAASLSIVVLGIGVTRLRASVRIETLFGSHSRLLQDYAWLEEHVGALVPIEALVTFDRACPIPVADRLELLRNIENRLIASPHVRAVTSCLDFLPDLSCPLQGETAERVLDQACPSIAAANYLVESDKSEQWRLTAHLSALEKLDYGEIMEDMRQSLASQAAELTFSRPVESGVAIRFSGLMPLVHEIQRQLLRDLFTSFLAAFLLIAAVMTIVQAGFCSGLLSMIPNVFPALALFGGLGWLERPMDIGSIMTASVAMGIAVDDTLHFLTFFSRQVAAGSSRRAAVTAAYEHCGRAMIHTTLICGAGLAIFALSDFVPTARFAWMMVALLATALVGDLLILPALLLSPIGRLFESPRSAHQADGHGRQAPHLRSHKPVVVRRRGSYR